jgi:hypothetical protein
MSGKKQCCHCKKCKPMEAFSADPRLRDGRMSRCKVCRTEAWMNSASRARKLAAAKSHIRVWTPTEDRLLRKFYGTGGPGACVALMPDRGRPAISQRAAKLGIVAPDRTTQTAYTVPAMTLAESLDCVRLRKWGRYEGAPRGQLTPALRMQG